MLQSAGLHSESTWGSYCCNFWQRNTTPFSLALGIPQQSRTNTQTQGPTWMLALWLGIPEDREIRTATEAQIPVSISVLGVTAATTPNSPHPAQLSGKGATLLFVCLPGLLGVWREETRLGHEFIVSYTIIVIIRGQEKKCKGGNSCNSQVKVALLCSHYGLFHWHHRAVKAVNMAAATVQLNF